MANKPTLSAPARNDLKEIWKYLAERNPTAADKFTRGFTAKFQLIADNPQIGRAHDEYLVNLRSFPHKDYVIFYFSTENGIEIYRVLHGARGIENMFEDYFEGLKP